MRDKELIKLGVAFDYPVNWSLEMVIRDIVQNFYDAIGEERFGHDFVIRVEFGNEVFINKEFKWVMETKGNDFSFEWLNYIGGSTKTDAPGDFIGMYGEGFKMCMLSLLKQNAKECIMESKDWALSPCIYEQTVSDKRVKMLGYTYSKRENDGYTRFSFVNPSGYGFQLRQEILYNFYYPGNPLFGESVIDDGTFSLHRRSSVKCPSLYPAKNFKGVLYINGLARARLDIPFIINLRMDGSDVDTRSRREMHSFEAKRLLTHFSEHMGSRVSYYFLIELQEKWKDIPKSYDDVETWYYCVNNLVRNVASSKRYSKVFKKRYTDLYYIDRIGSDRRKNNGIREVRAYAKSKGYIEWAGLNPIFRLLGARSLIDEYEEIRGEMYRKCDPLEKRRIELLFKIMEGLFECEFLYDERPEILMISNKGSGSRINNVDPLQFAERDYSQKNKREYRIQQLVLNSECIMTDCFMEAFLYMFERVIYAFCAKRSRLRAYFLTDLAENIIKKNELIRYAEKKWRFLTDAG